jgi:putative transposase
MVEEGDLNLSTVQQCRLLGISHSGYYYVSATESTGNLQIMQAIDKIHLDYPFYRILERQNVYFQHISLFFLNLVTTLPYHQD